MRKNVFCFFLLFRHQIWNIQKSDTKTTSELMYTHDESFYETLFDIEVLPFTQYKIHLNCDCCCDVLCLCVKNRILVKTKIFLCVCFFWFLVFVCRGRLLSVSVLVFAEEDAHIETSSEYVCTCAHCIVQH